MFIHFHVTGNNIRRYSLHKRQKLTCKNLLIFPLFASRKGPLDSSIVHKDGSITVLSIEATNKKDLSKALKRKMNTTSNYGQKKAAVNRIREKDNMTFQQNQ